MIKRLVDVVHTKDGRRYVFMVEFAHPGVGPRQEAERRLLLQRTAVVQPQHIERVDTTEEDVSP